MWMRWILTLCCLLVSSSAFAAADLVTQITASQSPALVYDEVSYSVSVSNTGNKNASSVFVNISLPATGTSPQVYVYGELGSVSPGCNLVGTTLRCSLGTINRRASRTVSFELGLPVSERNFELSASASTSSAENTLGNNTDSLVVALDYYATGVDATPTQSVLMQNHHCTGTGLTGWFECSLFPSSISAFESELFFDGTLGVPAEPGYTGSWELTQTPIGNQLTFDIDYQGETVASFSGWGADGACFEGLTTFPDSQYVAPYRVCPL